MRRLSSRATFYYKCVLPAFFVGCFLIVSFVLLTGRVQDREGNSPPLPIALLFVGGFGAAAMYLIYIGTPLKVVWLDGDELVVSNYLQKVRIPLADIVDVRLDDLEEVRDWSTLVRQRLATIVLKRRSRFGQAIRLATARGRAGQVPPLQELQQAIARAKQAISSTV